jgi:V8-like Glu-specific endopeptidase
LAGLTDGSIRGLGIHIAGYPTVCPDRRSPLCGPAGTTMWMDTGNIVDSDTLLIRYDVNTSEGQSGAPIIARFSGRPEAETHQIVGVHTESFDLTSNRGVRISRDLANLVIEWLNDSR